MTMITLARLRAPLLGVALVALVAACGASAETKPSVATLSTAAPDVAASAAPITADDNGQQAFLDYAQCMRDNGVDFPDPQFDASGNIQRGGGGQGGLGFDPQSKEFQAGNEQCQDKLHGLGLNNDPQQQAELQDSLVAFAQCMRDHGVDMADPQIGSAGGPPAGGGPLGDVDPESPEFKDASSACQDKLGDLPGPGDNAPGN